MLKNASLLLTIWIAITVLIIAFENLFFSRGSYYVLFWEINQSATWLIIGMFLMGVVFGMSLFMFFHSSPTSYANDDESDSTSDWE